ncbi:MAG: membrane protein [Fimbriimonadales bacterium]|nr:MAG: membrane protein [Fimbriimonadales bacterium]
MIWVVLIGVVVLGLVVYFYNSLAKMRNVVRSAWSDVDVQLKRRADLIPNLVETAKGYAGYEQETLESVVAARNRVASGDLSPAERAREETQLASRLSGLLAVVEQYPELKASAQFLRLQEELSQTENNIANARRYYNAAVRDYNTMIESFPTNLFAAVFGFGKQEYFELDSPEEGRPVKADLDREK